jgi:hypothetical protein
VCSVSFTSCKTFFSYRRRRRVSSAAKKGKTFGGVFGLLAGYVQIFTWILSGQGELDEIR